MDFIVDSREKFATSHSKKLRKLGCKVTLEALPAGDYKTKNCLFERKTVADFTQSIRGDYGRTGGRMFDQSKKMIDCALEEDLIPFIIIVGDFEEHKEKIKEYGKLNVHAIFGAIASVIVRYDINVVWNLTSEDEALYVMMKIAEKVEEGKLGVPHRQSIRKVHSNKQAVHVANVLRVSPKLAEMLVKKYGGLRKILLADPKSLMAISGIGPTTVARINAILGE